MKTFDELQRLWENASRPPVGRGSVSGICLRLGGGQHDVTRSVELTVADGLVGDRWHLADDPQRLAQVTLMNATVGDLIAFAGTPRHEAGDNFFVDLDLSESALPVGAHVRLGAALLEVTPEPHLGCKKFHQRFGAGALRWVNHQGNRPSRLRGVNLRVLEGGTVRVGDTVEVVPAQPVGRVSARLLSPEVSTAG
jgi:MOSC domain-containing protein YiiM